MNLKNALGIVLVFRRLQDTAARHQNDTAWSAAGHVVVTRPEILALFRQEHDAGSSGSRTLHLPRLPQPQPQSVFLRIHLRLVCLNSEQPFPCLVLAPPTRIAVTIAWNEPLVGAQPMRPFHSGFVKSSMEVGICSFVRLSVFIDDHARPARNADPLALR